MSERKQLPDEDIPYQVSSISDLLICVPIRGVQTNATTTLKTLINQANYGIVEDNHLERLEVMSSIIASSTPDPEEFPREYDEKKAIGEYREKRENTLKDTVKVINHYQKHKSFLTGVATASNNLAKKKNR